MVYTILIGSFFAFVKSINYRLHKLFGTDPLILKEEEAKDEEKKEDTTEDKGKATEEEEQDVPAAAEFNIEPYPTKTDELQQNINVEVHKSASSLNSTTDRTSMDTSGGTLEMSIRRSPGSRRTSRRSSPKADSRDINVATSEGIIGDAIAETVCKFYLLPGIHYLVITYQSITIGFPLLLILNMSLSQ